MRLVVDANVLVGELLRARGLRLLSGPTLELAISERAESEARYETERRLASLVRSGRVVPADRDRALAQLDALLTATVVPVPFAVYAAHERTARRRIPRDPDDWPTVALAIVLQAAIWTQDADFLGCGLPTDATRTPGGHCDSACGVLTVQADPVVRPSQAA